MEQLEFLNKEIIKIIISNPMKGDYKKVMVRKIVLKNENKYMIEKFTNTQTFHENIKEEDLYNKVLEVFENFKQLEAFTEDTQYIVLKNKKNNMRVLKKSKKTEVNTTHNKEKNYILKENEPIYPLIEVGVFNHEFKIIKNMYDKYKQINRFIEMIDDIIPNDIDFLNIVDFGCGKSYLTFVIYYYLVNIKKIKCKITGIDLKKDVIENCNKIKEKYHYDDLNFLCVDAKEFKTEEKIDMVISLHACDIITDFCLYNALKWNSKYIFSVPCCQHELNKTIKNNDLNIVLKHGLLKERFSSILTDSIRGEILNNMGYDVNLMEFVDFSHTPKNILIRAVKNENKKIVDNSSVKEILERFNINQTLYRLLEENK